MFACTSARLDPSFAMCLRRHEVIISDAYPEREFRRARKAAFLD
jgi:hypothetical protein